MDPELADDQSLSQYMPSHETVTRVHTAESLDLQRSPRNVAPLYHNMHGDVIQPREAHPYLPSWAWDTLGEYEDSIKKVSYIAIAVLCVFVAVGYVYSQPGSTVQIKWRRSVRKLKRLSRTSMPSFKEAAPAIYPFVKDFVHVAHVILNHIFD